MYTMVQISGELNYVHYGLDIPEKRTMYTTV